ncbi:hypothetical protein IVG45_10990 [Methylomonas sp. LL1]|uniref:hypothetical protein n=1 Tax=Methylomonas sp. LL1 TaxID=2785785 RepID=UPI0018C38F53|nr:hypothetical protein [Methylomonas sp. LL1]QPK65412.1 hypothetical protein IVG45_10990 [Methylomonas sp. LL1]
MKAAAGLLALLFCLNSANADTFRYLYIEANEGNSSGGHAALQFDDQVYHYQYSDGLIRLVKENAEDFSFDYRYLQNRTIHAADIEASGSTVALLKDYFKRQFWDQDRRFKRQQALENDRLLLEWLLNLKGDPTSIADKRLKLAGAGLFYSDRDLTRPAIPAGECQTADAARAILGRLLEQINRQQGPDFLPRRLQELHGAIQQLPVPRFDNPTAQTDYGFFQRYTDLLNGLLAVRALRETRPLAEDTCHQLDEADWQLDEAQRLALQKFQQHLSKTAQALLSSKRPDWGQALFVTLARLVAVEQSLQSGHWLFLDDFSSDAGVISTETYSRQAEDMQRQRQAAEQGWRQQWQSLDRSETLDDLAYTDLERAANRYREWRLSLSRKSLRYRGQQALPLKGLELPLSMSPDLSDQALQQALRAIGLIGPQLKTELEQHYAYDLLSRNCVTEIFRSINQALGHETEQRLGGVIDPDLHFIPFTAYAKLQSAYPVKNVTVLPSFRQQQLQKQYQEDFAPWVYLRESNIFSAQLYRYNPDDAAFLFFTDDGWLLRPLFGAFNTMTGLGQSLLGLFELPIDGGEALTNGTRGLMMSLPELAFINIRKGSYKFAWPQSLPD